MKGTVNVAPVTLYTFRATLAKCLLAVAFYLGCASAWADYRDTPQGKLEAAHQYADEFLKEDARPDKLFFHREVRFPTWKDQPVLDCGLFAIVRGVKTDTPYFENKKQSVVVVPVWMELMMMSVHPNAGYPYGKDESGLAQCRFEYEPYSFANKRFEQLPDFLKTPLHDRLLAWGTPFPENDTKYGNTWIAIAPAKRYVRFQFRISVARALPYQLHPQFPRHHPVEKSIARLEALALAAQQSIDKGITNWNSQTTDAELEMELARIRYRFKERQWAVLQLRKNLQDLQAILPFSDISAQ